jgi:aspartyl protease family protein
MSVFQVGIDVAGLEGGRFERVDAWVDTGAFYSSVPRPLLESLGVVPHIREPFRLADGRVVETAIGRAFIRIGDRAEITLVLFCEPESPPLLGAYSLEGLRLAVDPVTQRLVPMPWLPLFELLPAS